MKPVTPALYREAAAIVRRGWSRVEYATRDGKPVALYDGDCFCAMGALAVAAGARPHPIGYGPSDEEETALAVPLVASLVRAAELEEGVETSKDAAFAEVAIWNQKAASAEEVAAALERCAGELERGEIEP